MSNFDCLGRGRQGPRACLILAAGLLVLALPVGAKAKPGYKVDPGGIALILPIEQRAGKVFSLSADGPRQRVTFAVEAAGVRSSKIEYSVKGRVSSRRVKADFGALGRVDVKLRLARFGPGVFRRGPHCNGHHPLEARAFYRGTIEFAPEGTVPEISRKSGHGYFERSFRQVCRRQRPKPGPFAKLKRKIEEGILTVSGKAGGRSVRLEAEIFAFRRNPKRAAGQVYAAASERREGVRITRSTGSFVERGPSLSMSRRGIVPETVEVGLPDPFSGSAVYSRSPNSSPSWTGDLTVDLPDTGAVPLTGPGFNVSFCRGKVDSCRYSDIRAH